MIQNGGLQCYFGILQNFKSFRKIVKKEQMLPKNVCVTNNGFQLQLGYTTIVIKMLIRRQNIESMSEFNIEIEIIGF